MIDLSDQSHLSIHDKNCPFPLSCHLFKCWLRWWIFSECCLQGTISSASSCFPSQTNHDLGHLSSSGDGRTRRGYVMGAPYQFVSLVWISRVMKNGWRLLWQGRCLLPGHHPSHGIFKNEMVLHSGQKRPLAAHPESCLDLNKMLLTRTFLDGF